MERFESTTGPIQHGYISSNIFASSFFRDFTTALRTRPFILPNRSSIVYFHRSTRYFIESINLLQPLLIPVLPVFRNHQTSPSTGLVISIFSPWQLTEIDGARASNLVILSLFPPCMNIRTYSFVNLSIERFLPGTILAPAPRTSAIYACSKYRLRVNNDDRLDPSFEIVRNLPTISRYRGDSNYFERDSIFEKLGKPRI